MADKKAYIDYKNNFLLSMLDESKDMPIATKQEEISNSASSDEDEDSEEDQMKEEEGEK